MFAESSDLGYDGGELRFVIFDEGDSQGVDGLRYL